MSMPSNPFLNGFDLREGSGLEGQTFTDLERSKSAEHENRLQHGQFFQNSEKNGEN